MALLLGRPGTLPLEMGVASILSSCESEEADIILFGSQGSWSAALFLSIKPQDQNGW